MQILLDIPPCKDMGAINTKTQTISLYKETTSNISTTLKSEKIQGNGEVLRRDHSSPGVHAHGDV